ncbi:GNAT family N-acetyltransferase [Luteibacter sp. PPL552]
MEFRPIQTDDVSLKHYAALFSACFPGATHLNEIYLRWLYCANPEGDVVGFDAIEGDRIAAHYACIPVAMEVMGTKARGLLSLNTATHPEFQGKGLFTKLASRTYDLGAELGYEGIYGIANGNSTPGFTRKLGFTLISPLDARLGIGKPATIDWEEARKRTQFRRLWDEKSLKWRCANPANAAHPTRVNSSAVEIRASTDKPLISVWGVVPPIENAPPEVAAGRRPFSLFIGLLPEGAYRYHLSMSIPDKLRPSPLNFIYKSFTGNASSLERGTIQCSFVDFDAY